MPDIYKMVLDKYNILSNQKLPDSLYWIGYMDALKEMLKDIKEKDLRDA